MPSITQLEYIVAVEKEGHFGKAAKSCHISQPTLSEQIKDVEEKLKIVLFDRSKKPVLPTESGIGFINQAKQILREHQRLLEMANAERDVLSGTFKLGIIPTLSSSIIPLFLDSFSKKFPKINLVIEEMKTDLILKAINDEHLDAGILVTPLHDKRLFERHLFYEAFYFYVSKNHPFSKLKKVSEKMVTGDDLWLLQDGHCFRNQVLNICGKSDHSYVYENVRFESGNLETLRQLIQKGKGYTLLPELSLMPLSEEEIKTYVRAFDKNPPHREVSLVFRRTQWKRPILNAIEKEITEHLPKDIVQKKNKSPLVVEIQ